MIILQIFLWTIVLVSGFLAYEFYRIKDGRLRVLMIRLFIAKVLVYGGGALFQLGIIDFPGNIYKILINLPMFLVMLQLYKYIRTKE